MESSDQILIRIAEAIESLSEDIHKIKNAMCEEEGSQGIYVRGDIHTMAEDLDSN